MKINDIKNITTAFYELDNGFEIEIIRTVGGVEAWMNKKGYGIKSFIFGFAVPFYDNDNEIYLTDRQLIKMIKPEYFTEYENEFL